MQITRDNASSVQKMITQMFGGKNGTPDPYGTDYGNFDLRFTPTDRPFNKPNWDEIMTKRDKPAMSEDEFNDAIKELARKEFSTGERDHKAYRKLSMQFSETASPDRKAIYEDSMKKTGGKMNAACMFWDKSGNKTLSWHPMTGRWDAISTEGEFERAREFTSVYNDEIKRLKAQYGDEGKGRISMKQIHDDLRDEPLSASGTGNQLNVRG